jgi:hypothetical protein
MNSSSPVVRESIEKFAVPKFERQEVKNAINSREIE